MNARNIVIVGPANAHATMRSVAGRLRSHGHQPIIDVCDSLSGDGSWTTTGILVNFAVPCTGEAMSAMPSLQAIVSPLAGIDWIDLPAASERGILVVGGNSAANSESMAEASFMLILAGLYDLLATERSMREGQSGPIVREMLRGKSVGIIGFGRVARALVARLGGWHVNILASSRTLHECDGVAFMDLEALLRAADVVVLLASLDAGSRHLINEERLRLLRPGFLLVNTARGGLIDEQALAERLRSDPSARAMLDVFEQEPLAADSPLRRLPNVVLTPHAVGHTRQLLEAVPDMIVSNILSLLEGRIPDDVRNPPVSARSGKSEVLSTAARRRG